MEPKVKDFGSLIVWIAKTHHKGTVSAIADRVGVSVSTPNFWRREVAFPNLDNMVRLGQAYGVEFETIRALVEKTRQKRRRLPPISGGSDAPEPPWLGGLLATGCCFTAFISNLIGCLARPMQPTYCPA